MIDILVDIGNSALKWAPLVQIDRPQAYLHSTQGHLNSAFFEEIKPLQIANVFACSVAQERIRREFEQKISELGGTSRWFKAEKEFNGPFRVFNEYQNPAQLGADRWFAALGAISVYPKKPIVLVQFGTATTVDSIDYREDGYHFLGGCIAPGIQLMFSSLKERIPTLNTEFGQPVPVPKNTHDAIATGIIDCQIGLVEAAIEKLRKMTDGNEVEVVLTGGGIESFNQLHKSIREYIPQANVNTNLVLKGLRLKALAEV